MNSPWFCYTSPFFDGQIMANPHRLFGQHRKAFGQLLHLPASVVFHWLFLCMQHCSGMLGGNWKKNTENWEVSATRSFEPYPSLADFAEISALRSRRNVGLDSCQPQPSNSRKPITLFYLWHLQEYISTPADHGSNYSLNICGWIAGIKVEFTARSPMTNAFIRKVRWMNG